MIDLGTLLVVAALIFQGATVIISIRSAVRSSVYDAIKLEARLTTLEVETRTLRASVDKLKSPTERRQK